MQELRKLVSLHYNCTYGKTVVCRPWEPPGRTGDRVAVNLPASGLCGTRTKVAPSTISVSRPPPDTCVVYSCGTMTRFKSSRRLSPIPTRVGRSRGGRTHNFFEKPTLPVHRSSRNPTKPLQPKTLPAPCLASSAKVPCGTSSLVPG